MSKIFNDPIYGRIKIPEYCVKIIDTPEFQRLRNLKQLGLTNHVFYGATHTRFEHSIGVCWLSGEWAKSLKEKHPELDITSRDIEIVMIAGLVHDIGHGPFSHAFEHFIKQVRPKINYHHEDMTLKIFRRISPYDKSTTDDICDIISGKSFRKPYLAHIVHNTVNGLDADKLDYFIRDSQCTSFAIGCDWKRVVYESSVYKNEIAFPFKMVGDVFNLYQTRFRLYKELYFHKTVCMIEDKLLDIIRLADSLGVFKFKDSNGNMVSLAHSIDDVTSFLFTQDDIIGQMERCGLSEVTDKLDELKRRDFDTPWTISRCAHYGMKDKNPLDYVTFINKRGEPVEVGEYITKSMCPEEFMLDADYFCGPW